MITQDNPEQLVSSARLLEAIFDEKARPSIRWLQMQTKARVIPSYRIGHFIFYNVTEVRAALSKTLKVEAR